MQLKPENQTRQQNFDFFTPLLKNPEKGAEFVFFIKKEARILLRGDGLAQWLQRWTGDPKVEGSNPVTKEHKTNFDFFQS